MEQIRLDSGAIYYKKSDEEKQTEDKQKEAKNKLKENKTDLRANKDNSNITQKARIEQLENEVEELKAILREFLNL